MDSNEAALSIHPDALPCLKRQQLENLCVRLGVPSTGKRSDLIARLEGFATDQAVARQDGVSSSLERYMEYEDETREELGDQTGELQVSNSIRIISKPRESHFASVKAPHDEELEEVGMVLPSSGSHGSLSSLRRKRVGQRTEEAVEEAPQQVSKPSASASNLYPWKKLLNSATSMRSISSSSSSSNILPSRTVAAPSSKLAEMGLGLHASDSQSSISSTMRKWLKGEGTATITGETDRRITRSVSAASSMMTNEVVTAAAAAENMEEGLTSPRPKRKRSQDSMAQPTSNAELGAAEVDVEVPQRRIKPRPSRTACSPGVGSGVQERILAEMHARMAAKRAESGEPVAKQAPGTPELPPSPLKSMASRTRGRFSTQHERNFGRMDSIATHYAAVRANQGQEHGGQAKRARMVSTTSTHGAKEGSTTSTVRIAAPVVAASAQRTEEEREAVRRKLALARHRRRSSTAVGRKSVSGGTAKRSGQVAATPSSKLARHGFASKISGAMRGFMGAARGLAGGAGTASKAGELIMGPPSASPSKAVAAAKPVETRPLTERKTSAGIQSAPSNPSATKKPRSTFDLNASLARKPTGYTPYSAKETVGMLQSRKVSPLSVDDGSKVRSSSITFPSSSSTGSASSSVRKSSASRSPDLSRASDTTQTSTAVASPGSSTVASPRNARKTRSSTSTAARTSVRSPRKSRVSTGAVRTGSKNPAAVRRRQPSLQVAGQTMASSMMRERRMRTYAITQPSDAAVDAADDASSPSQRASPPVHVAGHGSPSKLTVAVRVDGKGRGKTSVGERRAHLSAINV